jgi:hypothetical protein
MKTRFKYDIKAMTGRLDDRVYYYHPGLDCILSRQYSKPERNPSADRFRLIMANLLLIQPSPGYIQNFRDYAIAHNNLRLNRENPQLHWWNLFIIVMFAMEKAMKEVDLTTLTRNQIYTQQLPCLNLKAAIDWEFLPEVQDYERFINLI